MKADTWMPFYIADYLRDTMHLTTVQHGAYFLLIMACWNRGGRLPNDPGQLAGMSRATAAEWRKMAPVLLPFFEVEGAQLVHGRVLEEHEKALRLSEARRDAGAKGGRPPKQEQTNDKPIGFANGNQGGLQTETPTRVAPSSPLTPPSEEGRLEAALPAATAVATDLSLIEPRLTKDRPAKPWLTDSAFSAAWDLCTADMRRRSLSRSATYPHWRRQALIAGDATILRSALEAYLRGDPDVKRTGGPGFHLWLKDGTWDHWTGEQAASAPGFNLAEFEAKRARRRAAIEAEEHAA